MYTIHTYIYTYPMDAQYKDITIYSICIHTYVHTYVCTYIHTYIHMYVPYGSYCSMTVVEIGASFV